MMIDMLNVRKIRSVEDLDDEELAAILGKGGVERAAEGDGTRY